VSDASSPGGERIRAAEVVAAMSLATDLGSGVPLEHGLHGTLFGMRLAERLGVDSRTASQTYYMCLLTHVGCTANAGLAAEVFPDDDALLRHMIPVLFGSRAEMALATMRALVGSNGALPMRVAQAALRAPKAAAGFRDHEATVCEVARMLATRLGLPASVHGLFAQLTERWDGKGDPGRAKADELPLALRIAHVARDAAFQRLVGGEQHAVRVIRKRAGAAFDPTIATLLADEAPEIMAIDADSPAWEEALAREPSPRLTLEGEAIDRALAAMGEFADIASPYLVGHSARVAELAETAARRCGVDPSEVRRAALVHDVGRAAVPTRIWQKPGPLTTDEWERVRLHAYYSERVLCRSSFLAALAPIATCHHERLDGSGYHRSATAPALSPPARLLAAADAYRAMTEPRPHREALPPARAAEALGREAGSGRLDADAVGAVLDAAGHQAPHVERPAGLTEREAEVVGLLARGLQTKQIARRLGISAKTADHHIQHAYAKIGVSTRAAAALYAMEHGLVR
jgi:putative nucleotidyltransferase with HDIG domain